MAEIIKPGGSENKEAEAPELSEEFEEYVFKNEDRCWDLVIWLRQKLLTEVVRPAQGKDVTYNFCMVHEGRKLFFTMLVGLLHSIILKKDSKSTLPVIYEKALKDRGVFYSDNADGDSPKIEPECVKYFIEGMMSSKCVDFFSSYNHLTNWCFLNMGFSQGMFLLRNKFSSLTEKEDTKKEV